MLYASYSKSKVSICMSDFIYLRKNTEGNLMRYVEWMLSSPVNENEVQSEEEEGELLTHSRPSTGKNDLEESQSTSSIKEADVRMKALNITVTDPVKVTPANRSQTAPALSEPPSSRELRSRNKEIGSSKQSQGTPAPDKPTPAPKGSKKSNPASNKRQKKP